MTPKPTLAQLKAMLSDTIAFKPYMESKGFNIDDDIERLKNAISDMKPTA